MSEYQTGWHPIAVLVLYCSSAVLKLAYIEILAGPVWSHNLLFVELLRFRKASNNL